MGSFLRNPNILTANTDREYLRRHPMILIIDDDDDQLNFYSALFESIGFSVVSANAASVGLSILQDVYVDLVLCDHYMPGMTGPDFIENLRKIRDLKKLPIVEFSALPEDEEKKEQKTLADAFCTKDNYKALIDIVATLISNSDSQIGLLQRIRACY